MRIALQSWRGSQSPALAGTFAVLALLPRVSLARTLALAVHTIVTAALPIAVTVLTGRLIGIIPDAVQTGLDSPAGRQMTILLIISGGFIVIVRALGPLQLALAGTFARQVDRYLQERLMAAVAGPRGIGHLEDPATLNLIRNAQGIGADKLHPGDAVKALASLLPSWLQALGSALILVTFQWWLGLLWLVMWPIVLYFLQREYVRVGQAAYGQADAVRRSDYLRDLALLPAAAKELRIWGMLEWLLDRFDDAWLGAMRPVWQARKPGRPVLWLPTAVVALANFGAFALLVRAPIPGDLTLASLAMYTPASRCARAFRHFHPPKAHLP